MCRSSFATLLVAFVLCATLSVAAVSEFKKPDVRPESVVPESVFDDVAAEEPVLQVNQNGQPSVPPLPGTEVNKERSNDSSTIRPRDYQDWRQAGAIDNTEIRSHQIRLTSDGMLPGRVVLLSPQSGLPQTVEDVSVFFIKMGVISGVVKPGPNGVFQTTGILPGVYGVTILGKDAFATFTIHVMPASDKNRMNADLESLRLEIAAIPSSDVPLAKQIFQPYLGQSQRYVPTEPSEDNIPEETKVTNKVVNSPKGLTTRKYSIALQADGTLIGRVRRLHPGSGHPFLLHASSNRIHFIQNNRVVYQVAINQKGFFKIPNFTPGVYSAVTAGQDGVGAIGCQIVPADNNARQPDTGKVSQFLKSPFEGKTEFVSFLQQGGGNSPPEFDITLLGPENFVALNQLLSPTDLAGLLGGGTVGGTGGGGGGAPSGGLPPELLGLLGLLALLASP